MRKGKFVLASAVIFLLCAAFAWAADKYNGPRPAKPDLPYLMHADNLIPSESADAKEVSKKDESTFTIEGTESTARTPLAEPIFVMESDKILPERLELFRLEVKNGHRELSLSKGRRRNGKALHLSVATLGGNLYKIEASEPLENGEYSLSPNDSNHVFCFSVY